MNILQTLSRCKALQLAKCHERLVLKNIYSTTCLTNRYNAGPKQETSHFTQQCYISSLTMDKHEPKPSLFKRILKGIGITSVYEAKLRVAGFNLYESVVDKLDYEYWMRENNMPDNFMSWFLITELHIWMLLVRCMMESDDGRVMRNSTIEALWSDVGIRSIKYHPGKRSLVRKQIQLLSQEFQAALVSYDEGLMTNDMVLAGAVWRRFFLMNNDDPRVIENIVRYIRKQVYELDGIPRTDLINGPTIKWIPLKEGIK